MNKRHLKEDAVIWESHGESDSYGVPRVKAPLAIKSRWEKRVKTVRTLEGDMLESEVEVFVDRPIALGTIIWEGEVAKIGLSPKPLYLVIDYQEIPDTKGRKFTRSVMLAAYNEALPTVV
jgi:hypothetical protein